jgi:threonine dehydrogenase-like Zn-dependent dehydrogenase
LEMLERPMPRPSQGQVRIRTAACAICATDLAMIAGWERTPFGAIPGHEWSGTVDAVGAGVDVSLVGRRCVAENVWQSDGGEVGFEHPGGYAEYFVTDAANVRVLPEGSDLVAAALLEPLAVCVRGLSRLGNITAPLLIMGDGPIGLLTLLVAARKPAADIALVGGRDERLTLAKELGASVTVNYHRAANLVAAVRETCGMSAFACIVEASGSAAALEACVDLAAPDAKILILGDYGDARAGFEWNTLLHKELRLIGSNASAGAWDEAVALAVGGLPLRRLVSHVVPAARFEEAVGLAREGRGSVVKVVMEW